MASRQAWLQTRCEFSAQLLFPPSRTRIANTKCRGSSKTSYVRQFLTRFRLTPHSLQADWPNAKEDQPLLCCCFVAFVWVFRIAFCWFGVLSACVFREGGCPKKAFELWLLGIYGLRVAKKFDALAASLVYGLGCCFRAFVDFPFERAGCPRRVGGYGFGASMV